MGRKKPAQYCFLDSEKRHERTPHGASTHLVSTVGVEVSRWQERHRLGWDASDGGNGGAERTGKHCSRCKDVITVRAKKGQGAIPLVLDVAKAFETVSQLWLLCGPGRRSSNFVGRFYAMWVLPEARSVRCVSEPLHTVIFSGSKWSCFLLRVQVA